MSSIWGLLHWPMWRLSEDIVGFFEGLFQGGQYSRRQKEPVAIPDVLSMPFSQGGRRSSSPGST